MEVNVETAWTALLASCHFGSKETVAVLLANGADVNIADDYIRWTPLMAAASGGNPSIVTMLLEAGADCNMKNWKGKTALDIARKGNNREIERILQDWMKRDCQ